MQIAPAKWQRCPEKNRVLRRVRSERSLDLFIFTGATLSRVGRTTVQFNTKVLGPSIFMSDYIIRKNYLPLR